MQPRKHAELIKAWADGAEIQRLVVFDRNKGVNWLDDPNPTWADDEVYRRKPVPCDGKEGHADEDELGISSLKIPKKVIFEQEIIFNTADLPRNTPRARGD